MITEKNEKLNLLEVDNFNLTSSSNILKVSSEIKLPNENQSLLSAESSRTRYTISATIDEIKKVLASVRSNDDNNDDKEYNSNTEKKDELEKCNELLQEEKDE